MAPSAQHGDPRQQRRVGRLRLRLPPNALEAGALGDLTWRSRVEDALRCADLGSGHRLLLLRKVQVQAATAAGPGWAAVVQAACSEAARRACHGSSTMAPQADAVWFADWDEAMGAWLDAMLHGGPEAAAWFWPQVARLAGWPAGAAPVSDSGAAAAQPRSPAGAGMARPPTGWAAAQALLAHWQRDPASRRAAHQWLARHPQLAQPEAGATPRAAAGSAPLSPIAQADPAGDAGQPLAAHGPVAGQDVPGCAGRDEAKGGASTLAAHGVPPAAAVARAGDTPTRRDDTGTLAPLPEPGARTSGNRIGETSALAGSALQEGAVVGMASPGAMPTVAPTAVVPAQAHSSDTAARAATPPADTALAGAQPAGAMAIAPSGTAARPGCGLDATPDPAPAPGTAPRPTASAVAGRVALQPTRLGGLPLCLTAWGQLGWVADLTAWCHRQAAVGGLDRAPWRAWAACAPWLAAWVRLPRATRQALLQDPAVAALPVADLLPPGSPAWQEAWLLAQWQSLPPTLRALGRRGWLQLGRACRQAGWRGVRELLWRPAWMQLSATHLDLVYSLQQVDLQVRRMGLDSDPGWLPWFGRIVHLHYEPPETLPPWPGSAPSPHLRSAAP